MRLGFHYHVPAMIKDGNIYMPGHLGRFIDSLAAHCQSVTCFLHTPRPDEIALLDYPISASNVSMVNIGPHDSVIRRSLFSNRYTRHLRECRHMLDLLLLRGPSPLLPAMASAAGIVPVAILLVGDYLPGVDHLPQPLWRKEAIRLWAHWNKWRQVQIARRGLTFVNSHVLYDELKDKVPNLIETRTTTLNNDNFYLCDDTCLSKPIRLLYVGRMDRTKGLLHLVEALALLVERGEDVVLDLVGWPEHNDPILDELRELARIKHVDDRVHYLGGKPLGPDLFNCYKQADIFIMASLFEGFPRTIWEAMAYSLPVVATRVGSISAYLEGAAELVQPGDVSGLANSISRLIHDSDRRKFLIREGRKLAEENTLERRSQELITALNKYISYTSRKNEI